MPKEFQTLFKDSIVPTPSPQGDWAKTHGGADIPDGQKETPGEAGTGVTYADVGDAPAPGSSLTSAEGVAGSKESGVSKGK